MTSAGRVTLRKTVSMGDPLKACEFLAHHAGLSRARIKDAMNKGAVWLIRRGRGRDRLRRATAPLRTGDRLELFYDPDILSVDVPRARCMRDFTHYSIWHKPAGLLTQGTLYGDHCSLLRQAETSFNPMRPAYPVHRIDREAEGLVVVAHTADAAGRLSRLFQSGHVKKCYRAEVLGVVEPGSGRIEKPLDGRAALTEFSKTAQDAQANTSTLLVRIETGRFHQIRRHLAAMGHPVMGDPRYGTGNKDGMPMRLLAYSLEFICPFTGETVVCSCEDALDRGTLPVDFIN